jgi:hypothetical protein
VAEVVGASHRDLARVRELVEARPALAKAAWDWGFGDWESALGAAAHTGQRDIARYLIDRGARPSLFSAAMLGQLAVVRAFVEAQPGVQRVPGPHGIPLLAHARAGGEPALAVVEYLASVGGAGGSATTEAPSEERRRAYVGKYSFGPRAEDVVEVFEGRETMMFRHGTGSGQRMMWVGDDAFHPAGAEAVRIRFVVSDGAAQELAIHDPGLVLRARRLPD